MSDFKITKLNESKIRVDSDDTGALMHLSEQFTFYVDGYKFMPSYRSRQWDGKLRLFDSRNKTLPHGLISQMANFAQKCNYSVDFDDALFHNSESEEELKAWIDTLSLRVKGVEITPREYQVKAFIHAVHNRKSLVISPTGSGKSLIIYMLVRYYMEQSDKKILITVPTTSLVEQMTKDFLDYSSNDPEFDEEDVHKIYSGKDKDGFESSIVVSTWQSIFRLGPSWFAQFGMVLGDEAHLSKAKSLTSIMDKLINAEYRIGLTGTLDGSSVNEMVLNGSFGPTFVVITTKELIEGDTLAQLQIKCLLLDHDPILKKACRGMNYQDEINVICEHAGRNNFIKNLALDLEGNTLIMFNLVNKHGKPLHKLIKDTAGPDRKVFFISGEVTALDREEIREQMEKEEGAIIVGSMGCVSTGINIKALNNIIFASPSKSKVKVLQSIGRGLRKSLDEMITTIYDISDKLSNTKKKNYTLKHGAARIDMYEEQGFDYEIFEIPMPY